MSGHNAAFALPPGDRDDAPLLPPNASSGNPVAGRDTVAPPRGELLPGIVLELDAIGTALDEAAMALGDLKLARAQGDWALLESAGQRLARLSRHVASIISQGRVRVGSHVAPQRAAAE